MEESLRNTEIVTRCKRHAHNDALLNDLYSVTQRQRKIKKFIRKIGSNPNNTLSNTSVANDNVDIKLSSRNDSDKHENTQDVNAFDANQSPQQRVAEQKSNSNKRRIIIPIRRTRINPTNAQKQTTTTNTISPATTQSSNEEAINASESIANNKTTTITTMSNEQKKKLFVKRRRITPKPFTVLEPSITQNRTVLSFSSSTSSNQTPSLAEINDVATSLELKTRLETVKRTYTYLVTRVHDNQSEIISAKFSRDQIKTFTDTLTHTVLKTALNIQPSKIQKFAHTLIDQPINE